MVSREEVQCLSRENGFWVPSQEGSTWVALQPRGRFYPLLGRKDGVGAKQPHSAPATRGVGGVGSC